MLHQPWLLDWLKDGENAAAYVQAVIEDGDPEARQLALRNLVEARSATSRMAKKASLNREALDRTLSKRRNPQLSY